MGRGILAERGPAGRMPVLCHPLYSHPPPSVSPSSTAAVSPLPTYCRPPPLLSPFRAVTGGVDNTGMQPVS
eukprot:5989951-Pyramimonas_sp.AAC.1